MLFTRLFPNVGMKPTDDQIKAEAERNYDLPWNRHQWIEGAKWCRNEMSNSWIDASTEKPKTKLPVIVYGVNEWGKGRTLRACYVPKFSIEEDEQSFDGDCEFDPAEDKFYWPEGWYEWNEFEDMHWKVTFEVTHWMYLPDAPSKKQ
jgi:Protein of unknown function (DUF551)